MLEEAFSGKLTNLRGASVTKSSGRRAANFQNCIANYLHQALEETTDTGPTKIINILSDEAAFILQRHIITIDELRNTGSQ